MLKFSCVYRSYAGYLCVSDEELYFTSPRLRMTIGWDNVKHAHQDTKTIKDVPRSVLVIKLWRAHTVCVEGGDAGRGDLRSSSRNCVFYAFQDLLGAKEHFMAMWKAYKEHVAAAEAARKEREAQCQRDAAGGDNNDDNNGSTAATTTQRSKDNNNKGAAAATAAAAVSCDVDDNNDNPLSRTTTTSVAGTRGGAEGRRSRASTTTLSLSRGGGRRHGSHRGRHTRSHRGGGGGGDDDSSRSGAVTRNSSSAYTSRTTAYKRSHSHNNGDSSSSSRSHSDRHGRSDSDDSSSRHSRGSSRSSRSNSSRRRRRDSSHKEQQQQRRRRHHRHHKHDTVEAVPVLQCMTQNACTGVQWLLHALLYGRLGSVLVSLALLVGCVAFACHLWRNAGVDRYLGGGIDGSSGSGSLQTRRTLVSDEGGGGAAVARRGNRPLHDTETLLRLLELARGECGAVAQHALLATTSTLPTHHGHAHAHARGDVTAVAAARACGVPGSSGEWVAAAQRAVVELVHNYVALQTRMAALRGRYSERARVAGVVDGDATTSSDGVPARRRRWRLLSRRNASTTRGVRSGTTATRAHATTTTTTAAAYDDDDDATSTSAAHYRTTTLLRRRRRRRTSTLHRLADDAAALRERVRRVLAFLHLTPHQLGLTRHYAASPPRAEAAMTATRRKRTAAAARDDYIDDDDDDDSGASRRRGVWLPWRRERWVWYSEPLSTRSNHDDIVAIAERVPESEAQLRHACVRLSRQLVDVAELLDRVLTEFTQTFLLDAYTSLARGVTRPSQWGSGPSALSTAVARAHARPPSPETFVLRVALLRRYATALLRLDALEADEQRRRLEALTFTRALVDVARAEEDDEALHASRRGDGVRNVAQRKAQLLDTFYDVVVQRRYSRHASTHADDNNDNVDDDATMTTPLHRRSGAAHDMLRNILEEVRFWQRHDDLWVEHVYAHAHDDGGDDNGTTHAHHVMWQGLPVFRGLLCYTPRPQRRATHTHSTTTRSAARDEAAEWRKTCGGVAATHTSSSSSCAVWAAELQRRRDERARLATHASDDDALTPSDVRAVETLWATELKVFAMVLEEMARDGNSSRAREYSVAKEELLLWQQQQQQQQLSSSSSWSRVDAAQTAVRYRLVLILRRVHALYLMPFYAAGGSSVLDALHDVLWPPRWWHRLWRSAAEDALDRVAYREMGLRNPALQAVSAQVLDIAWGGLSDAPQKILNSLLLQPPALLTLRAKAHAAVVYALVLVVVALASMAAVYALA